MKMCILHSTNRKLKEKLKEAWSVNQLLKDKMKELETIVQMAEYRRNNTLEDIDKCFICSENERNTVYAHCMHLFTCYDCCITIGNSCPACREESEYKRVFIP